SLSSTLFHFSPAYFLIPLVSHLSSLLLPFSVFPSDLIPFFPMHLSLRISPVTFHTSPLISHLSSLTSRLTPRDVPDATRNPWRMADGTQFGILFRPLRDERLYRRRLDHVRD